MSSVPDKIVEMPEPEPPVEPEPRPEEEVNILKEPVTVDLENPVTVDGVTYNEFTFDFSAITVEDDKRIRKTFRSFPEYGGWGPPDIDIEEFQELYLIKAGQIPLAVLRALGTVDKKGVYALASEWLLKCMGKKKRRKR